MWAKEVPTKRLQDVGRGDVFFGAKNRVCLYFLTRVSAKQSDTRFLQNSIQCVGWVVGDLGTRKINVHDRLKSQFKGLSLFFGKTQNNHGCY